MWKLMSIWKQILVATKILNYKKYFKPKILFIWQNNLYILKNAQMLCNWPVSLLFCPPMGGGAGNPPIEEKKPEYSGSCLSNKFCWKKNQIKTAYVTLISKTQESYHQVDWWVARTSQLPLLIAVRIPSSYLFIK